MIFSSRQKAQKEADLDEAADRAVRAALADTPTKNDLRVGEVKDSDKDKIKNRVLSKNSTYLGFGPGSFVSMGNSNLNYNLALGYIWETTARAAIRVHTDAVLANDFKSYYMDGILGLNLYLTDQDISPYLFLGVGFGAAGSSNTSATSVGGFAGTVGVGATLFRTSSTEFDIGADYHAIFANNTIGTPGFIAGRIAVLF